MIRSRQRQGRGDPQPASADIMEGVWDGRWDPAKIGNGNHMEGEDGNSSGNSTSGDDSSRCAVCLEEVVEGGGRAEGRYVVASGAGGSAGGDWTADIGSEEAGSVQTEDAHARGIFAYLPCGHRFHTYW